MDNWIKRWGGLGESVHQNTINTATTVTVGYLLPFFAFHLQARTVTETLQFLLHHTYFYYYLNCLALTIVVMGGVWQYLDGQWNRNYVALGVGYGAMLGIVFSVFYIILGNTMYSFALLQEYVLSLIAIGIFIGFVIGILRQKSIVYQ